MADVSEPLRAIEAGDGGAAERLPPLFYDELRELAAQQLGREAPGRTLQATELVHEAFLRLVGPAGGADDVQHFDGRGHFFAAAESMRRILIERPRARGRHKRGGDRRRVGLNPEVLFTEASRGRSRSDPTSWDCFASGQRTLRDRS